MPAIKGPVAPKNIVKKLEKTPPIIMYLDLIAGFIGTYIGKKVLIKFGQKYFKIFLNSILTIISIYLILNGFLNYDFTFSS